MHNHGTKKGQTITWVDPVSDSIEDLITQALEDVNITNVVKSEIQVDGNDVLSLTVEYDLDLTNSVSTDFYVRVYAANSSNHVIPFYPVDLSTNYDDGDGYFLGHATNQYFFDNQDLYPTIKLSIHHGPTGIAKTYNLN